MEETSPLQQQVFKDRLALLLESFRLATGVSLRLIAAPLSIQSEKQSAHSPYREEFLPLPADLGHFVLGPYLPIVTPQNEPDPSTSPHVTPERLNALRDLALGLAHLICGTMMTSSSTEPCLSEGKPNAPKPEEGSDSAEALLALLGDPRKALSQSEAEYRQLVENLLDTLYILDADGIISYMSPAIESMTGYTPEEMVGHPFIHFLHPDDVVDMMYKFRKHLAGYMVPVTFRILNSQGELRFIRASSRPILKGGRTMGTTGILSDVTPQVMAERRLLDSLREKEILLDEIHHRVRGTLQLISSLLSLQAEVSDTEEVRRALRDSRNRIRALALVHEKLAQAGEFTTVDVPGYLGNLVRNLVRSHGMGDRVRVAVEAGEISLDVDTAATCGLIVTELVSNSLLHGFPGDRHGVLTVSLSREGETSLILTVADNGVGLQGDFSAGIPNSVGLRLVRALAIDQLEGQISVDTQAGTRVAIIFSRPGHSGVPAAQ